MPDRRRLVALALLALVGALAAGLFLQSPVDGQAEAPFDAGVPEEPYAASMSLTTDGERFVEYRMVDDRGDGQQYDRRAFPTATYTTYWNGSHELTHLEADGREDYERFTAANDDGRYLRRDDDAMRATVLENGTDPPLADQPQPEALLAATLSHPGYERTGTTTDAGTEVVVYSATAGWYEPEGAQRGDGFRVIDADGEIHVEPDTGTLYYADVQYTAVRAGTWGEYLHERYVADRAVRTGITYEYEPGPVDATEPDWVPGD